MKTTSKLAKAKNGKVVRRSTVDPEGNTIKTKTNTRTGATKTVVKYGDSSASGARREVTKTPGLTREQIKANEMYAKNPQAAKEDDFKPFTPGMKNGGAKYKTGGMTNSNKKVSAIKSAGSKGTRVGVNKKVAKPKK